MLFVYSTLLWEPTVSGQREQIMERLADRLSCRVWQRLNGRGSHKLSALRRVPTQQNGVLKNQWKQQAPTDKKPGGLGESCLITEKQCPSSLPSSQELNGSRSITILGDMRWMQHIVISTCRGGEVTPSLLVPVPLEYHNLMTYGAYHTDFLAPRAGDAPGLGLLSFCLNNAFNTHAVTGVASCKLPHSGLFTSTLAGRS